jgi:hypothetical protein
MTRRSRSMLLIGGTLVIAAALMWVQSNVVWRDETYWALIRGYGNARSIHKPAANRWKEVLSLPNGIATVETLDEVMENRTTITYSDGATVSSLYPDRTYTNLIDVRVDDANLYVLRSITLFRTERRLLQFSLADRTLVMDRRVEGDDIKRQ